MNKQPSATDMTLLDEMKKMYPVIDLNVSHDGEALSVKSNSRILFSVSRVSEKKNDPNQQIVLYWDHLLVTGPIGSKNTAARELINRVQHGNIVAVTVIQRSGNKEDGI